MDPWGSEQGALCPRDCLGHDEVTLSRTSTQTLNEPFLPRACEEIPRGSMTVFVFTGFQLIPVFYGHDSLQAQPRS